MSGLIKVLHWDKFWIPSNIKEKIVEEALNSAHIVYKKVFYYDDMPRKPHSVRRKCFSGDEMVHYIVDTTEEKAAEIENACEREFAKTALNFINKIFKDSE